MGDCKAHGFTLAAAAAAELLLSITGCALQRFSYHAFDRIVFTLDIAA